MDSTSVTFLPDSPSVSGGKIVRRPATGIPRWAYVVGIHVAGLAFIVIALHLTGFVGSH